jgi:hypothetical protein
MDSKNSNFITMSEMGNYARMGNQMFQYAFMKSISLILDIPIHLRSLDTNDQYYKVRLNECFKLKYIPLDSKLLLKKESDKEENVYQCKEGDNMEYQEKLIEEIIRNKDKIININGYFQTEKYLKYIKKELLEDFQFKDQFENKSKEFMKISNGFDNVIALHVRRGDISNNQNVYPTLTKKYIEQSIEYINKKLENKMTIKNEKYDDGRETGISILKTEATKNLFLIFSDDHEYCKYQLKEMFPPQSPKYAFFLVPQREDDHFKNEYMDLCIMSKCDHFITSCSSFSWWGAYLSQNKNKIVISPKPWFNINHPDGKRLCLQEKDVIPEDWIRIEL